ncbi:hypothetical protein [Dapis sp. BLCC M172]|uniref:hypothetical protein n=1 Tax=Dapis sp. BLCC M172 TaxID=2975281 RepID=UPI003CF45E26
MSNTKLINLRYKYLGYYLGVRRQESGVRMNKFETIFYVLIIFFVKSTFTVKPFNSCYYS